MAANMPCSERASVTDARGFALALALCAAHACACSDEAHIRLLAPNATPSAGAASPPSDASTIDASPADAARADAAPVDAGAPSAALVLRYDFVGTGARVLDRAGNADAELIGDARLDGRGGVTLDGQGAYVNMPNGLVSRLQSATFVVWLEWLLPGLCWQRVFDFGINDAGEDQVGREATSLFMTPESCGRVAFMVSAEFSASGTMRNLFDDAPLPAHTPIQVALTIDAERDAMTMYLDGTPVAQGAASFRLQDIDDRNNWLGRSQWVQDRFMNARYDEFRIYDRALSDAEIAMLYVRGPDEP
jgi:hypothetical protein